MKRTIFYVCCGMSVVVAGLFINSGVVTLIGAIALINIKKS